MSTQTEVLRLAALDLLRHYGASELQLQAIGLLLDNGGGASEITLSYRREDDLPEAVDEFTRSTIPVRTA